MLQFVFDDLQHLFISMARSFKYFHDVELLYPSDEFQTLWIFNMFTCSYLIPWYMWPTQSWGLNLNMQTCWRSKVFEICQILFLLFCLKKDQFFFLLMLRNSSAEVWQKKTLQGNTNFSAANTVTEVSKVANERYLPYKQLWGTLLSTAIGSAQPNLVKNTDQDLSILQWAATG